MFVAGIGGADDCSLPHKWDAKFLPLWIFNVILGVWERFRGGVISTRLEKKFGFMHTDKGDTSYHLKAKGPYNVVVARRGWGGKGAHPM